MIKDNNENIDLKYIKEIKKVFREMKQNKIYYPYFNGKNLKYAKRLKFLAKKQLDLSSEYDTYNNEFNRKYWVYCLDLLNDNREILELNEYSKTKNPKLIIQQIKRYNNYNGSHGSYNAYYIKNNQMCKIFIKCIKGFRNGHYTKSGGNYSFEHDLVCDFSKIINDKYDYFQYSEI